MQRAAWKWLLAVVAVWSAGCSCGGEPPVESRLAVGFERPTDGQRLGFDEDEDPAAEGFQYEVVAAASDSAGRAVTLSRATLEVRLASEEAWTAGPQGVIEGGKVRFPATLLQPRTNVLRVTVEESGSKRTASQTVTVMVGAEVPGVDLATPAEGQVLREADDADPDAPGYQVRFGLKATGLRGASGLLSCGGVCGLAPVPFTVGEDGAATVTVTLSEPVREAQGAQCTAVVKRANGDVTSPPRGFTLDTEAPRLAVAAPVAPVATLKFDVVAVVRSVEDGVEATLSREGAEDVKAQVSAGAVTFSGVSVPQDGTYDFRLSLTDEGGNVTERPVPVVVASTLPSLVLEVPAVVSVDANGEASDGVQAKAVVKVNGQPVGTEVELWTTVTSRLGQPHLARTQVQDEDHVAAFVLDLAEGANTVKACVRNAAGTQGCSQPTTVTVQTGRTACAIVDPAPGDLVAGGTVPVRVSAPNGAVALSVVGPGGASSTVNGTASGGAANLSVPLAADGAWRLLASCAGGGRSQVLTVTRDTTKPGVAAVVRDAADGRIGPAFIDTAVLPGMQVTLDVTTEAHAQVFVQGCELTGTTTARADAEGKATVHDVTVPSTGTCDLSVRAVDLAGNAATQTLAITSAFAASTLSFVSPDPGRTLGPSDGTPGQEGGLAVSLGLAFGEGAVGTLALYLDTAEVGASAVAAADKEKTFADVALGEGVNVLRAVLTNSAGAGACASALYTVDTTPGAITLTSPATSTLYSLNEDQDPATPGIQRPLAFTLQGASPAAVVDACTDIPLTAAQTPCRDGSGWFTLATRLSPDSTRFSYPDGQYSLKLVLDDSGRKAESATVTLRVDGTRPEVTALEFSGDADGDHKLNLAESPSGAPVLRVSTAGLEADRPVHVRDAKTQALYGQAVSKGAVTEVTLNSLPSTAEADYSLVVVLTDSVGNVNRTVAANPPNPLDPLNAAALTAFRLDRVAPVLNVSTPANGATLGPAQDADPATAGFQLRVSLLTASDVVTDGVSLRLDPEGTQVSRTPVGRAVTHDFTVADTGTHPYMLTMSAVDEAGNPATVTRTVTVDLEAPSLTLDSPTSGQRFDTALVPVSVRVTDAEGRMVRVFTGPAGGTTRAQVGSLVVSNGVASGTLNFPDGVQDVTVEVDDAAGNRGSASAAGVDVHITGCDVVLTAPSDSPHDFVVADDAEPGTPGLQYTVRGRTVRCPGRTVTLLKGNPGTAVDATVADGTTGEFAFAVSLPDGEAGRLTVEMVDTDSNRTSDFVDYTVDVTPPAVTAVSPSETQLTFVAASNSHFFPTPEAGYVKDVTPGGDAEADFDVTVTGAVDGSFQFFYRGQAVSSPVVVSQDGQPQTVRVTLPHGTSGTLELRVKDKRGNQVVRNASALVDVVPPAQVAVTRTLVTGSERKALVDVAWTASGDDGVSGMPVGYDLRWTTDAQLSSGIPDEAAWYGAKVRQETGALLPAGDSSRRLTLPPLAKYFIEVRARDEVGNASEFRAVPALVNHRTATLSNPSGTLGLFGSVLASGDLNGDGRDDLVTGNFRNASSGTADMGGAYVYYDVTNTSAPPQVLLPSTLEAQQFFGAEVAVGNVGDAAGEGRPDVLVGSPRWSAYRGRAFLYFGRANQPLDTTPVEFRGRAAAGVTNFGWAARILPDLNGDGLGEVLLSADGENAGKGRAYLFFGRTRADWQAAATGREADNVPFVSVLSADRIIEGVATPISPATSTFFARRRGQATVGDLDGDGKPELTLSIPNDKFNLVYIFKGSLLSARNGPTPEERTLLASEAFQSLTRGLAGSGGLNGFGVDVLGATHFSGSAAKDLVISQPSQNSVHFYLDGAATGFGAEPSFSLQVAADSSVSGVRFFGYNLGSADINQDGFPDLVTTENATDGSSAWVLYHRGTGGSPFDAQAGEGFAQSRFKGLKSLGAGLALGDFNGDGSVDVAAGDPFDTPGKLFVWY